MSAHDALPPAAPSAGPSVVCIGVFDGVHRGHQALLAEARAVADGLGLPLTALTFDPHPMSVVGPRSAPTSLASLAAGNIAATGGLASLIGEKEFSILFHEGERDNMHISVIDNRLILVVIFDKRSSVGLVRLRVRRAGGFPSCPIPRTGAWRGRRWSAGWRTRSRPSPPRRSEESGPPTG